MNRLGPIHGALLCAAVAFGAPSYGEVESRVVQTLQLEAEPLDVAVSPDGQWTFVLTTDGQVHIYSASGKREGTIGVGTGHDSIASSTRGDRIFLGSQKDRKVQVVEVAFVQQIDTAGSPFQGPADAPVEVVVFNDFQ